MSDIFREVDEALQQEKILNFWKKNAPTLVLALVVLLVSTAAGTFYKNWNAKRNAQETMRLSEALQADDPHTALNEVLKDTRKNHNVMGLLSAANLYLQEGKTDEAAKLFLQVAEDKGASRNLRDLARLNYVQSAQDPNMDVLKPLLSDDKSPWIWHARIEAAVISAHQDKDYKQAIEYLKPVMDVDYIPYTLKQRAEALIHVYNLQLQKSNPAPVAAQ